MSRETADIMPTADPVAAQLIAASTDGLAAVDLDGRCLSWSPSMARITGIPAATAEGRRLADLLPDLSAEELLVAFAGQAVTRKDQAIHLAESGPQLWLDVTYSPLHLDGALAGAILVCHDATERKRVAAQIRETEQRFTTMADVAPVLLWLARTDSLCTFFNQSWLDFTGRTLEEEWGVGWAENIHPEDVQFCLDHYQEAFAARQVFEVEYRLLRHDGVYRWILDRGTPRYGPDGDFAGYIGSCIDISDRKQMETDLRQAVRTRDEFLSIASHELRTPLTGLTLLTDSLQRALRRDPASGSNGMQLLERLDLIRDQARRLETIITSLLDVSRTAQGRLPMRLETVDLTAVVRDVVGRLGEEAAQVGSTITVVAPDSPVLGRWDRLRLDQVVTNLVVNAIKYGRGQPIDVQVETAGTEVRLLVRDRGIGIAESEHERIFGQFERAVSEDYYGGFGVGLWIARRIVEALQGTIRVESRLDEGACFIVSLECQR